MKLRTAWIAATAMILIGMPCRADVINQVVAYEGMQVPGQPAGGIFLDFGGLQFTPPVINASGEVAFYARIDDAIGSLFLNGIWAGPPDGLANVVLEGEQPPGISDPSVGFFTIGRRFILDRDGHVAFGAFVNDADFNKGIWAQDEAGTRLVAIEGMDAPNTPAGYVFTALGASQNFLATYSGADYVFGGGRVAFFANDVHDGVSIDRLRGIWSERPSAFSRQLQVVARTGQDTDFIPSEVPSINGFGQTIFQTTHVVFKAEANNPGGTDLCEGIWTDRAGGLDQLELIALTKEQPPGLPPGSIYTSFIPPFQMDNVAINASSQIAFLAQFEEADGTPGTGLWAEGESGKLFLVARTGDTFDLPDGSTLTVTAIDFAGGSGNQDGRPSGLSDSSQVVFRARGSDSIFVATIDDPLFADGFE